MAGPEARPNDATDSPDAAREAARLAVLARTGLVGSGADPSFDRLARLAGSLLEAPIALVSLVDDHQQYFKSCIGLPEPWQGRRATPLSHSFCRHVVATGEPLVIEDARLAPAVRDNPAIEDLGVVAYLGVPLEVDGQVIGSLCAIDTGPHAWSARDVAILRDLAESVVAEVRLRFEHAAALAARERLQVTLASIGDGVVVADGAGLVTFLNPVAEALCGWPNAEAIGRPLGEVFRVVEAATRRPVAHGAGEVGAPGGPAGRPGPSILIARDGAERVIEHDAAPIRDEQGGGTGLILVGRDATDKARVDRELADARTRLDAALSAGSIATWTWDIASDRVVADENLERLFGVTPEEARGGALASYTKAIHPEDRGRVGRAIAEAVASGRTYEVDYRVVPPGGPVRSVVARGTVLRDDEGRPLSLPGVVVDVTERKRAEDEIQQRETRLRLATEAARLGVYAWDPAGDRASWENAQTYEIFGLAPGEPPPGLEAYLRDIAHPDDAASFRGAMAEALRGGRMDYTGRIVRRDGATRWVKFVGRMVARPDGTPGPLVGVVADVTEPMTSAEFRRRSEDFQRLVFESVADFSIFTTDPAGTITSWNTGAQNVFGFSEAEAVGQPAALVFTPEDRAAGIPEQELRSAAETGRGSDERWHVRKDGTRFFASGTVRPITDGAGRIIGYTKVARDVTAAQLAADALRRSEEKYRTLFDTMDEGFCVIEVIFDAADRPCDYRFLETNPAFVQQGGPPDAIGRRINELAPGFESHWFEIYGRVARTGEPMRFVNEARALEGRWFDVNAFRVGEPGENKVAVLFNDITRRKRAEAQRQELVDQLTDADRRKDEFLAMLAHELRNPLGAISSGIRLVRATGEPAALEQVRDLIERQTRHLTHLIDDLLDVSRIATGKIVLRRQTVELGQLLARAVDQARPFIEEKRHALTIAQPAGATLFVADLTRSEQVLGNLLTNAAKYTPAGGTIHLDARVEADEVVLAVTDNGVGIAAEMLPQVFGLFTQIDSSIDRSQGGLGIGLTLVRTLVEMHGGRVSAASDGPDRGSTFTVRLPVGAPEAVAVGPTVPEAIRPVDARRRILIVDDNRDTARMTARLLAHGGNQTLTAHDGHEGVEAARAFRPDVVLLDIGLPGMNGYEVARALRDDATTRDAVIVAVSGYGEDAARGRSLAAGFDHHLTKPLDFDHLAEILRAAPAAHAR